MFVYNQLLNCKKYLQKIVMLHGSQYTALRVSVFRIALILKTASPKHLLLTFSSKKHHLLTLP